MNEDEIMKKKEVKEEKETFSSSSVFGAWYKNKVIIIYNQAVCGKDKKRRRIKNKSDAVI